MRTQINNVEIQVSPLHTGTVPLKKIADYVKLNFPKGIPYVIQLEEWYVKVMRKTVVEQDNFIQEKLTVEHFWKVEKFVKMLGEMSVK